MTTTHLPHATPDLPYRTCADPESTPHHTNRCTCDWDGMWLASERQLGNGQTTDDPWAGVRG